MIATTLDNLADIAEIVGATVAALAFVATVVSAFIRFLWPTRIRWAHVYETTDGEFVLNTRVISREKVAKALLSYYAAEISLLRRCGWTIPFIRRKNLTLIQLKPFKGYKAPPTISAADGTTTWSKIEDVDLLLTQARKWVIFGKREGSPEYKRFRVVGKKTWHVSRKARLVTGFDGRKAIRRIRKRTGNPDIPDPTNA